MKTFSIYEAKAKLSELIRYAKHFGPVIITERGVPVVQVAGYTNDSQTLEDRTKKLKNLGLLAEPKKSISLIQSIKKKRGALNRFLEDRD